MILTPIVCRCIKKMRGQTDYHWVMRRSKRQRACSFVIQTANWFIISTTKNSFDPSNSYFATPIFFNTCLNFCDGFDFVLQLILEAKQNKREKDNSPICNLPEKDRSPLLMCLKNMQHQQGKVFHLKKKIHHFLWGVRNPWPPTMSQTPEKVRNLHVDVCLFNRSRHRSSFYITKPSFT